MLRAYALNCNVAIEVSDFRRIVDSLKNSDWVGLQAAAEENARSLAQSAGISVAPSAELYQTTFRDVLGVAEVFLRDGDLYYFELISTSIPRAVYNDPAETYFMLSNSRVRADRKKILEIGIISSKDEDIQDKLGVLAADVQTAITKVVDGRRVRHFSFDWVPRQAPSSRIENLRERFAQENVELNIVTAELNTESISAADVLAGHANRSLLIELKSANFAREADVMARRGTKQEETRQSLELLKSAGLVKPEYLLQCKKSSALLVRVDSPEDLRVSSVAELPCATCSRKFKDELVTEGYSISSLGKRMTDGSHWMTVWVTGRLADVGVPLESIFWNLEESGEEVDIMVDFMGELWLIELKDREFGAGDAHPFNYRTVRYRSNRAFIISTDRVSPDAKKVFAELNAPPRTATRNARASSEKKIEYVEGLDKVGSQFRDEVIRVSSRRAGSYLQPPQLLTGINLTQIVSERADATSS